MRENRDKMACQQNLNERKESISAKRHTRKNTNKYEKKHSVNRERKNVQCKLIIRKKQTKGNREKGNQLIGREEDKKISGG